MKWLFTQVPAGMKPPSTGRSAASRTHRSLNVKISRLLWMAPSTTLAGAGTIWTTSPFTLVMAAAAEVATNANPRVAAAVFQGARNGVDDDATLNRAIRFRIDDVMAVLR